MTRRVHISTKTRKRIIEAHAYVCHLCKGKIDPAREAWDVSHEQPLELNGADDATNWFPAHRKCHRAHTAAVDIPNIAKAKRREANHIGAKARSSRPFAGWRKFNGEVVRNPKT